jgi:hypothetical protein
MTGHSSWRSLRTVMVVTIHVAAVAYVIRSLIAPSSVAISLVWVPVTISVAVFLSWPLGRAITWAFDPGELPVDRTCPNCGRGEVRPLIRPGTGLFQPASGYRCVSCWTTFRHDGGRYDLQEPRWEGPVDPSGIAYLSDPAGEDEIRFLDEGPKPAGVLDESRTSGRSTCRDDS